ncbi:MAG: hypothetical protein GY841_12805 [FCB group bacterium]|nr:hypothetical protein [FCB group bacterium]
MFRVSAIITSICFFAVTVLQYSLCSLCLLFVCPKAEAAETCPEPPPPCRACCPSQETCQPNPCEQPANKPSVCDISPCFLPDQPPAPVCVIKFASLAEISTDCACKIKPPHLDDILTERRILEIKPLSANTSVLNTPEIKSSGNFINVQSRTQGIHATIASTVLRL